MSATITGIGTSTPRGSADQRQATALALDVTLADPSQRELVRGLYTRAGVRTRGCAVLRSTTPSDTPLDQSFFPDAVANERAGARGATPWPTTGERMAAFERLAGPLAIEAARAAIAEESGSQARAGAPDQVRPGITHLVSVSCTGLAAPGVDVELVRALGLSAGVQRVNIGFMGCHGAIVALRTARAICDSDASARVLIVCVELCTLHMQRTARVDQHVANALFGDGAAACVVSGAPEARGLGLRASTSRLFDASEDAMGWHIEDHGFAMRLDRGVPALLERELGGWVGAWIEGVLTPTERASLNWCVHPGGPRVLEAVERGLGLAAEALEASRAVLAEHGNMSSATVLFILRRLGFARPTALIAFGPGLTGEAIVCVPMAG